MKKKPDNSGIQWEKLVRVPNFLPPPEKLIFPPAPVKVTITLNKSSIDFFKRQAKKHGTKYQRMIRSLLDQYVSRYDSKKQ